jgi:cbb3-type cytochrome oxidase maturation protein
MMIYVICLWVAPSYFALKFVKVNIIFYLIIISLVVAAGFLTAFFWAVRDGQYDDEYTPGVRILLDDDMIDNNDKTN